MKHFDCAVIGGGPAGAVTALVLARSGRRVILIDRTVPCAMGPTKRVGESLPGAARPLLRHLDLLSVVEAGSHLPSYGNSSAWGSSQAVHSDFILDPNGLGWHLDRAKFDDDLRASSISAGASFATGSVDQVEETENGWRLKIGAQDVTANWIVDATGRAAQIAKKLGAVRERDDQLMALYSWVQPSPEDRDTRTLIESAPNGWWYTSMLSDGTRIVAFHTDSDRIAETLREFKQSAAAWRNAVNVHGILRAGRLLTDWKCTEACGGRLDRFSGKNWLATGDAALSFDPLSSQGIFNSIYCGMKAAEAIHKALSNVFLACEDYTSRLEAIRAAYLANQRAYYMAEQRWSHEEFWSRRQKIESFSVRGAS